MKKVMLLAAGVSCLLVSVAVPVRAQSSSRETLKGEVPFAFVAGDRNIAAGKYSIEIKQMRVLLFDASGHPVQVIFSNPHQDNATEEQPRLVFHQYGERYFLRQIWTRDYKVDFPVSRTEYNLKAGLKADPGTVTIATR